MKFKSLAAAVTTLSGLSDTSIVSPADQDILYFKGSASKWENQPVLSLSNFPHNFRSVYHPDTDYLGVIAAQDLLIYAGAPNNFWTSLPVGLNGQFLGVSGGTVQYLNPVPSGTVELQTFDGTQHNHAVTVAFTALNSYTLAANTFNNLIVRADGMILTTSTSVKQDVNIYIRFGGTQLDNKLIYHCDPLPASQKRIPWELSVHKAAPQAGALIDVGITAAGADAQTVVYLNHLEVLGVV